jgi:DNA-binding XRE family transcriptional regulator
MVGTTKSSTSNGANCYLANCETLRVSAGKKINDLANQSKISRDTIRKIEREHPVTGPVAHAIFNVLNDWHKGRLVRSKEIQERA